MKLEAIELPFQTTDHLDLKNYTIQLGNQTLTLDSKPCFKKVLKVTQFRNKFDGSVISKVVVLGNVTA